ncbi:uncharacterized protein LOC123319414 [Coccinella septempunctata]|uniref:uncharacterized protein LOC123319414 n=1 Tax=Coccinella septempunctata TaxID=41139 RepID=UPI001D08E8DB|nr:uncharacterized protein LOC123319414 [Coccinella septempunctata]XP_044762311.1 uncharacterized protein LOC123319414 [Coccinella septempunctata]
MALHHVLLIFIIIVLWTNIASVQARRGEEMAREFRRGDDMKERRTRKFDEMILSTARGYGKRTNGQLRKDFLLEWIAMERMRDLGYPRYVMNNAELSPE